MPLYLQNIDFYYFLVNVIDYPVMGGVEEAYAEIMKRLEEHLK